MKLRNVSAEAQHVLDQVVEPGATVEATGDTAESLLASPTWKRADRPRQTGTASKRKAKAKTDTTPDQSETSDEPDPAAADTTEETD